MANYTIASDAFLDYTRKGQAFFSKIEFALAAGETVYTLAITSKTKSVIMQDRIISVLSVTADVDISIELHEGATVSDNGTPIPIKNNNRNYENGTTMKNFLGPTVVDEGPLLPRGNRVLADKKQTTSAGDREPYVLGKNKNYLLKIINNNQQAETVIIFWAWWEEGDFTD